MSLQELFEAILGGALEEKQRKTEQQRGPVTPRSPLPHLEPLPQSQSEGGLGGVMRSVVQIVALREGFLGGMNSAWTGSGTIVHPQGIILTNCHVANPRAMGMSAPPADRLGIALTDRSDRAPALTYFGEVIVEHPELDLAVVRIIADIKGRGVGKLQLPAVPLGNSDELELGDQLSIFGFPGIGGETVTYTSGNVSGFSSEQSIRSPRAWIKTDATISGGNSGGTAVNKNGFLVGIPTQAAAGTGITPVDARPVLDTNRDGRIDHRDTPMAIGGFINGLRPINLAIPLLQKAGMQVEDHRGRHGSSSLPEKPRMTIPGFDPSRNREKPEFSQLLFSTQITDDGRPINPRLQIPPGIHEVYATFEYENMQRGIPWSAVWMNNGKIIIEQKENWDDGPEGRKAVKIRNQRGVPNGEYHLVLGIGGSVALEGKVQVGPTEDDRDAEISGTVTDAETGRGVGGAVVVVLKPQASLRAFLTQRDESDVASSIETASDGTFTLPTQLLKNQTYSLVVAARGFEPLAVEHALRVGPNAPEHANIGNVELQRM